MEQIIQTSNGAAAKMALVSCHFLQSWKKHDDLKYWKNKLLVYRFLLNILRMDERKTIAN